MQRARSSSKLNSSAVISMGMSISLTIPSLPPLIKSGFWLARGELDRAIHWAEEQDARAQHLTSFARERLEVARARILLFQDQPTVALQRLEPVLQRATAGQRWGHVIEIRLLQASGLPEAP